MEQRGHAFLAPPQVPVRLAERDAQIVGGFLYGTGFHIAQMQEVVRPEGGRPEFHAGARTERFDRSQNNPPQALGAGLAGACLRR